ncbi:aminoglycoside N(3)-acetyltransferase [Streptomyces sp. NBC_00280]|uniref:aminoglycoside N(3)-acetyltransferase n=1 Tax=Streptomyces sp. NBC_00280 TaxID=2975699 RepID=UPI00352F87CC
MADGGELTELLRTLEIRRGGVLMVHASLRDSGLRDTEVRDALLDVLGPAGTLVVPAFTQENSRSSRAHRALTRGLGEQERAEYEASMLPFEPLTSPCRAAMGVLAECVRTSPGAVRSAHPQTSMAGIGPRAAELLDGHDPHCLLGERSPLARLYAAQAQVLLLRVGFEVCTAFHLAEYRTNPPRPRRTYECVVEEKGHWVSYEDTALDDSGFAALGGELPRELVAFGELAGRKATLVEMRPAVDFARDRMSGYRHGMT